MDKEFSDTMKQIDKLSSENTKAVKGKDSDKDELALGKVKIAQSMQKAVTVLQSVSTKVASCVLAEVKFDIAQSRRVFAKAAAYNPKSVKEDAVLRALPVVIFSSLVNEEMKISIASVENFFFIDDSFVRMISLLIDKVLLLERTSIITSLTLSMMNIFVTDKFEFAFVIDVKAFLLLSRLNIIIFDLSSYKVSSVVSSLLISSNNLFGFAARSKRKSNASTISFCDKFFIMKHRD